MGTFSVVVFFWKSVQVSNNSSSKVKSCIYQSTKNIFEDGGGGGGGGGGRVGKESTPHRIFLFCKSVYSVKF